MVLVEQLRLALQAIEQFDRHIVELAPTLPDYRLFEGLPGAGPHLAPRLLVAFGEDRERFQRAEELQNTLASPLLPNAAAKRTGSIGVRGCTSAKIAAG